MLPRYEPFTPDISIGPLSQYVSLYIFPNETRGELGKDSSTVEEGEGLRDVSTVGIDFKQSRPRIHFQEKK